MTMINVLLTAKKATELANDGISSDVEYFLILLAADVIEQSLEGNRVVERELYGSDSGVEAVVDALESLGYKVEITNNTKRCKRLEITWN